MSNQPEKGVDLAHPLLSPPPFFLHLSQNQQYRCTEFIPRYRRAYNRQVPGNFANGDDFRSVMHENMENRTGQILVCENFDISGMNSSSLNGIRAYFKYLGLVFLAICNIHLICILLMHKKLLVLIGRNFVSKKY